MFTCLSVFALALAAVAGVDAKAHSINQHNVDIAATSDVGRNLMHHARRAEGEDYDYDYGNMDTSFLAGYSVKFQGCHHVQQWNPDAEDEDDVRIMTKRLVRFRLCPSSDCTGTESLSGCSSNYGDYVVDMETFVGAYFNGQDNMVTECTQLDFRRQLQDNDQYNGNNYYQNDEDVSYYVGPYCADQGGEIRMGVFQDDTCTTFANNGDAMYSAATGSSLVYSQKSMVDMSCLGCSTYNDGAYATSEFCSDIYYTAGKCETRMNAGYPNESSCSYIEGIKIIREDGVIRTASTKKSKAAAVSIGVFLTIAVLLAGYVYYLRTKLSRAKINLSAASQSLS